MSYQEGEPVVRLFLVHTPAMKQKIAKNTPAMKQKIAKNTPAMKHFSIFARSKQDDYV